MGVPSPFHSSDLTVRGGLDLEHIMETARSTLTPPIESISTLSDQPSTANENSVQIDGAMG